MLKVISVFDDLEGYVKQISEKDIQRVFSDKKVVNNKEVLKESHDALLPTQNTPNLSAMSEDEIRICHMIYKRLLSQFLPLLTENKTQIIIKHGNGNFLARGKIVVEQGWRKLYGKLEDNVIPNVNEGDVVEAEEFINHEEILESLEYAQKNKGNKELIEGILDKANRAKGLTHREAAVLLECDDEELTDRMFKLAEDLKKRFYGNRIVMFAPLYLSNYCVNGCVYCPYHAKNKTIARKKLTQDEIRREVIALQDMGHKRLALEAGEDPVNNPIEYILECINTIYSIKCKNKPQYIVV